MLVDIVPGETLGRDTMLERLVDIQYTRNDYETQPGTFRVRGDCVDIFPSYETTVIRVDFFGDDVEDIREFDPVSGKTKVRLPRAIISPAKHFVMPKERIEASIGRISAELDERLVELERQNKLLEAQRLRQRTEFDLEMLRELGYCNGIENYSRPRACWTISTVSFSRSLMSRM